MRGGISFPPWPRFRRPPYNPGRPDFPWSGLKPWLSSVSLPIVGEVQALVRIRPVFRGLPTASRPGQHRCDAGFIKPATALTRTPPSVQSPFAPCRCYRHRERRVPPPQRTLLLRHRYYKLMRQARLALLSFDSTSRLRSPCRLLPAPAASRLFPTLALRIFPMMPGPLSRRLADCTCLVLPLPQRPSPQENGSAYRNIPLKRLHSGGGSRLQPFRYVQGRGRDSGCPLPPAQTRAGAASAHGSYLGCLASKRTLG